MLFLPENSYGLSSRNRELNNSTWLKKYRKNFAETTFISYILVGASHPQPPPDRELWFKYMHVFILF
jgi:hypothetical protein